jgi:hypothetical protein
VNFISTLSPTGNLSSYQVNYQTDHFVNLFLYSTILTFLGWERQSKTNF